MQKAYKKIIIVSIIFFITLIIGTINSNASSNLYLNELKFEANINTDGSMDVKETWTIKIKDTNTLFKTFTLDQSKYAEIKDVTVKDLTGDKDFTKIDEKMYHVTKNCYYALENSKGSFEIAWGVGLDDDTQTRSYEIKYKVIDAVAKYNDYAELYWQFVGKDFQVNAKEVKGIITLPKNVYSNDEIKVWGHNENLNGEIYAEENNKIKFEMLGYVPGTYIEIRTLFPTDLIDTSGRTYDKEILNDVVEEETKWADLANIRRTIKENQKIAGAIAICVISVLIDIKLIKNLIKNKKEVSKKEKFKPTQDIIYYRDIPRENSIPSQAVYLLKEKMFDFETSEIGKIFTATLLDLNLKKFIDFEISEDKKKTITIKILKEIDLKTENKNVEVVIFEFLKKAKESYSINNKEGITLKQLQNYIKTNPTLVTNLKSYIDKATQQKLEEIGIIDKEEKEKYSKKTNAMVGYNILAGAVIFLSLVLLDMFNKFLLLGTVSVIVLAVLNALTIRRAKQKMNVYTQKGVDEISKWKGLKKYMEEFSMLDEKEIPEIVLWEKFLVFATAFGIADKVLKQLKIVYPNFEQMDNFSNLTYMNLMLTTNFSNSFSSSMNTAMSSAFSSGSGAGGGFSGGGGGGRRPVEADGGR